MAPILATAVVASVVWVVAAMIILFGAFGVILSKNPVHSALSLVATLFGVAIMFILQDAQFLAAVQVIVYAGAIVVLFLFVIMLLGVDQLDDLESDPLPGQRPLALLAGIVMAGGLIAVLVTSTITGLPHSTAEVQSNVDNVTQLGRVIFTDYLFPFEVTSVLLVIAVVGAVVLARSIRGPQLDADEPVTELGHHDRDAEAAEAAS
jgi:NADH-quinone oxidoreductase subunit J